VLTIEIGLTTENASKQNMNWSQLFGMSFANCHFF